MIKIAFQNVKKDLNKNAIYIFSLVVSVFVYHLFAALGENPYVQKALGNSINLKATFVAANVLLLLFVIAFVFYANGFLLRKRASEIGLYRFLGMSKLQVYLLMLLENILMLCLALMIGLGMSLLFSKFFGLILLKIVFADTSMQVFWSTKSIVSTVRVFFLLMVATAVYNGFKMSHTDLLKLLGNNAREIQKAPVSWRTFLLAIISIVCLAIGYSSAFFWDKIMVYNNWVGDASFKIIFLLLFIFVIVVIGTYGFFHAFIVWLLWLEHRRKKHFKGLNMLTESQLTFQMKRNANTLASIATMCAIAMTTMCLAIIFYTGLKQLNEEESPTDFIVDVRYQQPLAALQKEQPNLLRQVISVPYKIVPSEIYIEESQKLQSNTLLDGQYEKEVQQKVASIMSWQTYQKIIKINPYAEKLPHLKENDIVLSAKRFDVEPQIKRIVKLANISKKFQVTKYLTGNFFEGAYGIVAIVSDETYKKLDSSVIVTKTGWQLLQNPQQKEVKQAISKLKTAYQDKKYTWLILENKNKNYLRNGYTEVIDDGPKEFVDYSKAFSFKADNLKTDQGSFGVMLYILGLASLVFIVATATIITLKQLVNASEERSLYQLLQKIGVLPEEIKRTVYQQNAWFFAAPILLSVVHTFFALSILSKIRFFSLTNTIYVLLIFVFLYSLFYVFTVRLYIKSLNLQEDSAIL